MESSTRADRLELFNLNAVATRVFHLSWMSFFLCFLAWFGVAPLMPLVRDELQLTKDQIGNTIIASVALTVLMRLLVGWLCDRIGPRLTYSALLMGGSLPVMGIGLAESYETFLLFRLATGAIGASFVITQYHTTVFYSEKCLGAANATSAGWGNLGGGVAQMLMPALFAGFVGMGVSAFWGWRLCMVTVGALCALMGVAYLLWTQDTPEGNFSELRARGAMAPRGEGGGSFWEACRDRRVWVLFVIYGACFGVELTLNNVAALYFTDYFHLGLKEAGMVAGLFGLMNLFARTLGGVLSDKAGARYGVQGRVLWLVSALLLEGLALMVFSQVTGLVAAVGLLIVFSVFVKMAQGATFAVVPFVNRRAFGSVAGIVGSGGNAAAMAAGFLFKGDLPWDQAFWIMGVVVVGVAFSGLLIRLSPLETASSVSMAEGAM